MKDDFFPFANRVFSHKFFCLVWLKDWNNIPWLLFYPFQDINKQNAYSIPKHKCQDLSCWWNRSCLLWRWTTGFFPLFWLLFGFWCVMVNPSLIHSNKLMHKISFIFVKMLQALFRDFHASAFLICCEQAWHPFLRKAFSYPILHAKYILHILLKCLWSQQFHALLSAGHPIAYSALVQWFLVLLHFLDVLHVDHLQGRYGHV